MKEKAKKGKKVKLLINNELCKCSTLMILTKDISSSEFWAS